MGQTKIIKGRALFKHEIAANWEQSSYIPSRGEKVLYDPDEFYDYTRVKYGDGSHKVKELPFADEKVENLRVLDHIEQAESQAGCKGYYWGEYSYLGNNPGYIVYLTLNIIRPPVGENINLATIDPSTLDWQVGDRVSIANQTGEKFPTCKIASINGATVGVYFSGTVGTDAASYQRDDDRTIFNIDRPQAGIIDIGYGAKAYGLNSKAIGPWSTADGQENLAIGNKSFAEGSKNIAYGNSAHAEGYLTVAEGQQAHAEGYKTKATGQRSHAEGESTTAEGQQAHAEGWHTVASGCGSHAEGISTVAKGHYAHSEGYGTEATYDSAHAEGQYTHAYGTASHAEGSYTIAESNSAHAEGFETVASVGAHAEGYGSCALGWYSHAEGVNTKAQGVDSHAEGEGTKTTAPKAHAEGTNSTAAGHSSHAEGHTTQATANFAHAEGQNSTASAECAHAEGNGTTASGAKSHAEGTSTKATNNSSHAEGHSTTASGEQSHAEGLSTTAFGYRAHAEGYKTNARGANSHAEGYKTQASAEDVIDFNNFSTEDFWPTEGQCTHTEGWRTWAKGPASHAEGIVTLARGVASHAAGCGTIAYGEGQTVVGKFNVGNTTSLFIVGCGDNEQDRRNAFEVALHKQADEEDKVIVKVGTTSLTENEFKQVKNIEGKANNSELATVAKSGSYNDLTNKPTIPSIDGLATTTYVDNKVASIIESAPETLNTLNELAAALGNDPNFATTVLNQLGNKLDKNEIPLSEGTGTKSLVLMDGKASGDYSFEGGSTDKSIAQEITGISMSLNPAEAKGAMSMAFGGNATTYSPGSVALGANVSAGYMAYYFDSIDFTNKKITLSTTRRASTLISPSYPSKIDWVAGDIISIKNDENYVMCSKITAVSGNVITVDKLPFDKINYESALSVFVYTLPHDRTIMNNTQPDKGVVALGFGAVSMGGGQSKNNAAQGMMSYAFGYENTAGGNFSFAAGRENTTGYGAVALGIGNKAEGMLASTIGYQNESYGKHSIAVGNQSKVVKGVAAGALGQACKAGAIGAFAIGSNVYTNESDVTSGIDTDATNYRGQVVVGRYNANPGYNTFVVGTGTSSTAMNALEVSNKFSTFNTPLQVKKLFGGKTPDTSYGGWMAFGHHDGTRNCLELSQGGNLTTTGWASFGGKITGVNEISITTSRNDTAGLAQNSGVTRLVCGKYADTSYAGSIVVGNGDSTTNKNSFTVSQGGNVTAEGWIKANQIKIGSKTLTEEQLGKLIALLDHISIDEFDNITLK